MKGSLLSMLRAKLPAHALALLLLTLAACDGSVDSTPSVLRVSALPDQSPEAVLAQHGPLIDYVCARAAVSCQWVESDSYLDLVEKFDRKELDLAFFGGVTYVMASENGGALPLVIRDIDARFSSGIFVSADDAAESLQDLQGYSFSFGVQQSTSGHYMPRHFLQLAGVDPETFFGPIMHSNGHDDTLRRISKGDVDAGVVNMQIARQMLQREQLELRLVWETPPYLDYVWVVQRDLGEKLHLALRDAFLSLRMSQTEQRAILELQGARGFLPASEDDYAELRRVMNTLRNPDS